jgi:hypothetical protein
MVLQAARGPVLSLANTIAGENIRGSWWGHPKSGEIFRAARAVCENPEVLVCKLVDNKVTYVHRRGLASSHQACTSPWEGATRESLG